MTRNEPPCRLVLVRLDAADRPRGAGARDRCRWLRGSAGLVRQRVEVVARLDLRDDRLHVVVPCFTSTRMPGVSGRASSWKSSASNVAAPGGQRALGRPRGRRGRCRGRRRTPATTDCGAAASSTGAPAKRMPVDGRRDARREDLDPVADAHGSRRDATGDGAVVAQRLGSAGSAASRASPPCGRSTSWTGSRNGSSSCSSSSAAGSVSSSSSSAGPSYQGVRSERSTMLSPSSAETGRTCRSSMPSSAATASPARRPRRRHPARSRSGRSCSPRRSRAARAAARRRRGGAGLLEHALAAVDQHDRRRRRSSRR